MTAEKTMTAWGALFLWALVSTGPVAADIIHFTDGMRTVCQDMAWEEDGEVRCEYQGGVLTYSKADVQRIEKTAPPDKHETEEPPSPSPARPRAATSPPALQGRPSAPGGRSASGLVFYDPRRPKKFWSSETRHHDSLREAVAALAAEFNRPPEWVEAHMGDTNDLLELRANLAGGSRPPAGAASPQADAPAKAIEFYNPRRTPKYWTGPDSKHNTFHEALEALAREFNRPAAWVEAHMGEENDLEQIRKHLSREAARAKSDAK